MILADSSVWIDHLRNPQPVFWRLLEQQQVYLHPFVIGELALGNLRDRSKFIAELKRQPQARKALDSDVLALIENNNLYGKGLGYVDAHLLASARIHHAKIWTRDKRLNTAAINLGLAEIY